MVLSPSPRSRSDLCAEPSDGGVMHVEAARDARQALALVSALPGLALLVGREFVGPAHLASFPLGPRRPLARPGADQLALELREARQYRQHETAVRGVVVSAQGSPSERNMAPFSAKLSSTLRRSLVLLANRSSRVTSTTSPCSTSLRTLASCAGQPWCPRRSLGTPAQRPPRGAGQAGQQGTGHPC